MDTSHGVVYLKRAKALLGTLVEISVPPMPEAHFIHCTDMAFARIAAIHSAMSFHEPDSDVQRLCRASPGDECTISPDTWRVLQAALAFERDSDSVFNITIAPYLVLNNRLPKPVNRAFPAISTLTKSIELLANNAVRIHAAFWLDVGGIAKGYAVDAAIAALQQFGVADCIVNAGGDLRVAGNAAHKLALRNPQAPTRYIDIAHVNNLACATSAAYFQDGAQALLTHHPDIVGAQNRNSTITSATVVAADCMTADALTKVLWLRGLTAKKLLAQYNAQGVLILSSGEICRV